MTIINLLVTLTMTFSFASTETTTGSAGSEQLGASAAPFGTTRDGGPVPIKKYESVCSTASPGYGFGTPATMPFKVYASGSSKDETCELALNPVFAAAFKSFVPKCAVKAASESGAGGGKAVTSVSATQMGAYSRRPTNIPGKGGKSTQGGSWSRHSTGEAVDLEAIILNYGDGSSEKIDLTKQTSNNAFYDAFRACWNTALDGLATTKGCLNSIACTGKEKPANALHDNHMHISYGCSKHSPAKVADI